MFDCHEPDAGDIPPSYSGWSIHWKLHVERKETINKSAPQGNDSA